MSALNREKNYDSLSTALQFILGQWSRAALHTAFPGIIEEYNAETRRARVRMALRQVLTDGTESEKAPAVNVPVIFPAGGGFSLELPLAAGDCVWLMVSERGLSEFKTLFDLATPDTSRYFSEADVVAIAGFGPLAITPATTTGAALQSVDGLHSVRIEEDRVEVHSGSESVIFREAEVVIQCSGDVKINVPSASNVYLGGETGQELATKAFVSAQYNIHTHSTPAGLSGPPVTAAPLTEGTDITKKTKSE